MNSKIWLHCEQLYNPEKFWNSQLPFQIVMTSYYFHFKLLWQATVVNHLLQKIKLNFIWANGPHIKYKTAKNRYALDLSQKVEKSMLMKLKDCFFYSQVFDAHSFSLAVWDLGNEELNIEHQINSRTWIFCY